MLDEVALSSGEAFQSTPKTRTNHNVAKYLNVELEVIN